MALSLEGQRAFMNPFSMGESGVTGCAVPYGGSQQKRI